MDRVETGLRPLRRAALYASYAASASIICRALMGGSGLFALDAPARLAALDPLGTRVTGVQKGAGGLRRLRPMVWLNWPTLGTYSSAPLLSLASLAAFLAVAAVRAMVRRQKIIAGQGIMHTRATLVAAALVIVIVGVWMLREAASSARTPPPSLVAATPLVTLPPLLVAADAAVPLPGPDASLVIVQPFMTTPPPLVPSPTP